jgi:hypothetical protein
MLSSAVGREWITPNEAVRECSEPQSLDSTMELRNVVARDRLSDSNDFEDRKSVVSCDGMVGGEESEVHRELDNSLSGGRSEIVVRSDCSLIVGVLETEKAKETGKEEEADKAKDTKKEKEADKEKETEKVKEKDTENKGELKREIPPNETTSPLSASVSSPVPAKSKNLSEAQNGTVDVSADEQSADYGKQTQNNIDPQDIDETNRLEGSENSGGESGQTPQGLDSGTGAVHSEEAEKWHWIPMWLK